MPPRPSGASKLIAAARMRLTTAGVRPAPGGGRRGVFASGGGRQRVWRPRGGWLRTSPQDLHLALGALGVLIDRGSVLGGALAPGDGARGFVALGDLELLGAVGGFAAQRGLGRLSGHDVTLKAEADRT